MSDTGTIVQIVAVAAMLLLVLRGLGGRGLTAGRVVGMALTWTAIFLIGFLLFANRHEIGPVLDGIRDRTDPATPKIEGDTVRIPMAEDGHFWVRGRVNDAETRFLIDSGATTTALSARTAEAAGIDLERDAERLPVLIGTANGTISAKRVTIRELEIGSLRSRDLVAVTAPEFGAMNVLGMNFLSNLKGWSVEGRTMVLRP